MKSNRTGSLVLIVLTLASFASTSARAAGGDGTKGGQGVRVYDKNGEKILLRDLIDKGVCRRQPSLLAYANQFPAFRKVLETLKKRDWYLGAIYENEAQRLVLCLLEAPLKFVDGEDPDPEKVFFYPETERPNLETVAVREDEGGTKSRIFLFVPSFKKMPSDHQAGLFAHEITHSFVRDKQKARNGVVRNITNAVVDPTASLKFFGADGLDLTVPWVLEPYKDEIRVAFDPTKAQAERGIAAYKFLIRNEAKADPINLTDPEKILFGDRGMLLLDEIETEIRLHKATTVQALAALAKISAPQLGLRLLEKVDSQIQKIAESFGFTRWMGTRRLPALLTESLATSIKLGRLDEVQGLLVGSQWSINMRYQSLDLRKTARKYEANGEVKEMKLYCAEVPGGDQTSHDDDRITDDPERDCVSDPRMSADQKIREGKFAWVTPLVDAVRYQHPDVVRWLLSQGASKTVTVYYGQNWDQSDRSWVSGLATAAQFASWELQKNPTPVAKEILDLVTDVSWEFIATVPFPLI